MVCLHWRKKRRSGTNNIRRDPKGGGPYRGGFGGQVWRNLKDKSRVVDNTEDW